MHEQTRIEGGWAAPLDSMVGAVLGRDPTTPCFEVAADPATASTFFLRSCTDLSAIHPCQRDSHYVSNQKDTSTSTTTLWLDAVLLSRTLSEHEVIVIMSICVHESQSMFRTLQYGCSSGYRTHTRTLARVRSCRRTTHDEERQAMA